MMRASEPSDAGERQDPRDVRRGEGFVRLFSGSFPHLCPTVDCAICAWERDRKARFSYENVSGREKIKEGSGPLASTSSP